MKFLTVKRVGVVDARSGWVGGLSESKDVQSMRSRLTVEWKRMEGRGN